MDMHAWLTGIIDGEGCFQITEDGTPTLTVMVAYRDAGLVERCREAGSAGTVRHYPNAKKPVSTWIVKSKADLQVLVALLDANPPQGKKYPEWKCWRNAVLVHAERRNGGNHALRSSHNLPLNLRLRDLRAWLMQYHAGLIDELGRPQRPS